MKKTTPLNCGVKFCGGCNPRYDRMEALNRLKMFFNDKVNFDYAKEDIEYDVLLVIGGCTNCCASHEQYNARYGMLKMWEETGTEHISESIEKIINEH
jgi:hypothetical protein